MSLLFAAARQQDSARQPFGSAWTPTGESTDNGLDMTIGAVVATTAMAGDLFSSFVKRRLNFPPSSQALGLDQVPESRFPMPACRAALSLPIGDITLGMGIFFIGELILSRLLYQVHLRDRPY